MDDNSGFIDDELTKIVSRDGANLTIVATKARKEQWQLSVLNEHGISSNWLEYYTTAQQAIDAGIEAIEEEGIEPFIDTEGFEYLFEENV